MAHPFELTHEIEVPATPEEVWDAIATANHDRSGRSTSFRATRLTPTTRRATGRPVSPW